MNKQTYLAVSTDWSKMAYLDFESTYEKSPETIVWGSHAAWSGWDEVLDGIGELASDRDARVVTVDVYPGIRDDVLERLRERLSPSLVIDMRELLPSQGDLDRMLAPFLTDDRVRGRMCYMTMEEFLDAEKLAEARARVKAAEGRVLVYGVGAALVAPGEVLVCADLARWEAQLRYRAGRPNYFLDNADEDMLRKVKCGFFVEWRVADRHKFDVLPHADLYLDTNGDVPSMTTVSALIDGLGQLTRAPFRLVPYFDPGVWGGQWMREVCKLPAEAPNYAWAFDGVPEENSVYLRFGDVRIESPTMNLTKLFPREFLGRKTFARWQASPHSHRRRRARHRVGAHDGLGAREPRERPHARERGRGLHRDAYGPARARAHRDTCHRHPRHVSREHERRAAHLQPRGGPLGHGLEPHGRLGVSRGPLRRDGVRSRIRRRVRRGERRWKPHQDPGGYSQGVARTKALS